jgi:hypothetical protein
MHKTDHIHESQHYQLNSTAHGEYFHEDGATGNYFVVSARQLDLLPHSLKSQVNNL